MTSSGDSVPARSPGEPATQSGAVTVRLHESGEAVVVEVIGELDMGTAPQLWEPLRGVLDRHPAVLVLDLLGVDFLASAGLSVLIELRARALGDGLRLAVVATGHAVLRALEITGLEHKFDLYPTRAAALAG